MLTCGELRAILADTDKYPDDMGVSVVTGWGIEDAETYGLSALGLTTDHPVTTFAISGTSVEWDEEPEIDDDFPLALEYSTPGEEMRDNETAAQEAAMEREYFGG